MNEEALKQLYSLAQGEGYSKSYEDFIVLMSSNESAIDNMYTVAQSEGYKKTKDDFKTLVGFGGSTNVIEETEDISMGVMPEDEKKKNPLPQDPNLPSDPKESALPSASLTENVSSELPTDPFDKTILADKPEDPFDVAMSTINRELIDKEEQFVVPELNYRFNDYGFTFEETGIGDAMTVESANGEKITVDLDPIGNPLFPISKFISESKEAKKLRKFLEKNKVEAANELARTTAKIEEKKLQLRSQKEVEATVKLFSDQTEEFRKEVVEFTNAKADLDELYESQFAGLSARDIKNNPQKEAEYENYLQQRKKLMQVFGALDEKKQSFAEKGALLDREVGRYVQMQSKQGSWGGGMWNAAMKGMASMGRTFADLTTDFLVEVNPMGIGYSETKFQESVANDALRMFMESPEDFKTESESVILLENPSDSNTLKDLLSKDKLTKDEKQLLKSTLSKYPPTVVNGVLQNVMTEDGESIVDVARLRTKDAFKKILKYYEKDAYDRFDETGALRPPANPFSVQTNYMDIEMGVLDAAKKGAVEVLGSKSATEQWDMMQRQSFLGGAYLGLGESLPAMLGGKGIPGLIQRTAQMYALTTSHVDEEMAKDPAFDDISENQKYFVKVPVGLAVGALEAVGFRNIVQQKGLLNGLIARAIGQSNSKTTAKSFQDFVRQDVESMIARGLLTMGAGGLAEFETGFFQEAATIGFKEIFDAAQGKNLFQNPDTFVDIVGQMLYAGAQEAVGGLTLGSIPAVSNMAAKGKLPEVDDGTFKIFEGILSDPQYKKMFVTKLKQEVIDGKKTQKEADQELKNFEMIEGLAPKVPVDYTTEQKKQALQLLLEQQKLESSIEGKAPELVKREQARLDRIKESLEAIQENAAANQQKQQDAEQSIPDLGTQEEVEEQVEEETDVTSEERTDIEEAFGVETTTANNLFFNRKGKRGSELTPDLKAMRGMVIDIASKAANSIKTILPNTKIVLHESMEEFNKVAPKGRGFFDFDNNTIHINLEGATATTVPHEVFHAVLFNKLGETKTAEAVTKMIGSVRKSLDKNSMLSMKMDDFQKAYQSEGMSVANEEALAELFGMMAADYKTLTKPSQNAIVNFIKNIAKKFGIDLGSKFTRTDKDIIDLLNTLARKTRTGEEIVESDIVALEDMDNGTNPIGNPTNIVKPKGKGRQQKIKFKDSYPLSLVKPSLQININSLINSIADKNQKVWFWVADQLGLDAEMDIDAGPSFALQKKGEVWSSSFPIKRLEKNVEEADYIFIISGSPSRNHLFNKKVYDKYVEKFGDFATFKKNALETNPPKKIRDVLNTYESWQEIKEVDGRVRKDFLVAVLKQKNTPRTAFHKLVQSLDGFIDPDIFRDGFYRENNFQQNDIMVVLKPTGVKEGANHSTYTNTILGEVIGIPDRKVDAFELMPKDMRDSMKGYGRNLTSQKLAPYGSGIRQIKTKRRGRQQKEITDVVSKGRDMNFRDEVIKDFLVRRMGFPAGAVNKIMDIDVDLFNTLPKAFANIEGGMQAGVKLFKRVKRYEQRLINGNKRRKVKLTEQQIADQTLDYLQKQPEYIKEGDGTINLTTKQAQLQVEFQRAVGTRASENVQEKLNAARLMVQQRKRGAKDLQKVKSAIRNFIRQSLPADLYTRSEVMKLVRKVTNANESNIENIFDEVSEFVNVKNNRRLENKIQNILNGKYLVKVGGKVKASKISLKIKERIDNIKKDMLSEGTSAERIDAVNNALGEEFDKIAIKNTLKEGDFDRMVDIQILINLNNSLQMENTDVNKTGALDTASVLLDEMIQQGRNELKEQLAESHAKYKDDAGITLEEVTGEKVDMNDTEALDDMEFRRDNSKKRDRVTKRIRTGIKNIAKRIEVGIFATAEALDGLMDRISILPGEMFGGRLQEMVTDRIDGASRQFKGRMLQQEQIIKDKMKELYGPKWAKKARKHNNIESTGIYKNPAVVEKAQQDYNNNKNGMTKAALNKILGDQELYLSQNQMYYLYNQYKDPANRKSFENMYGKEHVRIMKEMEAKLEPEVKAFADWQVNEYFPSLYEYYNETYKAIYRTNMPWNQFYAGRIYREGIEMEILNLLDNESIYNTSVGAASTKARVENKAKIEAMNGNDVLASYLRDMEYFAAYAEPIRDINKMFSNKYVANAIKTIHGETVYSLIKDILTKVANKGGRTTTADRLVNAMNTVFIIGRIALSPVITIKQLTSMVTYINDIGFINYTKYAMKNIPDIIKTYKEIRDNSVYMQDRKNQSIFRVIESYNDNDMKSFIPSPAKQFYINFMMFSTKFGDRTAIMLGGMPNYAYYKDQALKQGKTEQEAIDIAIKKFERDTKRTQQSQDLQDKDIFQTSNPVVRGMNMFLTTPKQYLRKEIQGARNLFRKIRAMDANAGKGTIGENLRTFFMYHVVAPTVFQYVSMGLPGLLRPFRDDDDEDLMRAAIIGNLNALFILGEAFQAAGDFFTNKPYAGDNTRTVGILQIVFRVTQLAQRYNKTVDPEKKQEAFEKLMAELLSLTSLPAPTLKRFIDNYSKVGKDSDIGKDILRLLNFSEYQIEGPPKKSSSKKTKSIAEQNAQYYKEQKRKQNQSRQLGDSFLLKPIK